MVRYSYNYSFIPTKAMRGGFMFYFSATRWVDDRCIDTITIFQREITGIGEVTDPAHILGNGQAMADLAYQLVSEHYAARHRQSNGEINARPSDTSTN